MSLKTVSVAGYALFLIFCIAFVSCKKEEEISENLLNVEREWLFVPTPMSSNVKHFHEVNGFVSYRNGRKVCVFDQTGKLVNQFEIPTSRSDNQDFPFMFDGSIYVAEIPSTAHIPTRDRLSYFLLFYPRNSDGTYDPMRIIDIRQRDTSDGSYAQYSIRSIQPDYTSPHTQTTYFWVLASKSNFKTGYVNKPVLTYYAYSGYFMREYALPDFASNYNRIAVGRNGIVQFRAYRYGSDSYSKDVQFIGSQAQYMVLPDIRVLGDFVLLTPTGFHISSNGLTLDSRINGLPEGTEILHSRDSLLFIKSVLGFSTFNAITGSEVSRFDLKSKKMPIGIDSVSVIDYYTSRNGISYLVTDEGIVVAR